MSIPKPEFDSCDETSLTLKWHSLTVSKGERVLLQYKEPHVDWKDAQDVAISQDEATGQILLTNADLVDLKPGTPYFVRFVIISKEGSVQAGPETVFDTKPIDCGPKGKKSTCSMS